MKYFGNKNKSYSFEGVRKNWKTNSLSILYCIFSASDEIWKINNISSILVTSGNDESWPAKSRKHDERQTANATLFIRFQKNVDKCSQFCLFVDLQFLSMPRFLSCFPLRRRRKWKLKRGKLNGCNSAANVYRMYFRDASFKFHSIMEIVKISFYVELEVIFVENRELSIFRNTSRFA